MTTLPASPSPIDPAAELQIAEIRAAGELADEPEAGTWSQWGLRVAIYAAGGLALFAAFCTPLSMAREYYFATTTPKMLLALAALILSSVSTGLAVDRLVRSSWNVILVALAWIAANSVVTPLIAYVIGWIIMPSAGIYSSPQNIALYLLACLVMGLIVGVMCLHLTLPICTAAIWLARRVK